MTTTTLPIKLDKCGPFYEMRTRTEFCRSASAPMVLLPPISDLHAVNSSHHADKAWFIVLYASVAMAIDNRLLTVARQRATTTKVRLLCIQLSFASPKL
jgi:hypothetical protein